MSKELEALEKIDHTVCLAFNQNNNAIFSKDKYDNIDCKDINEFITCYEIIETALKKQEQDQPKLKALEIIKEKSVNVYIFLISSTLKDYNETVAKNFKWRSLTQEEYDLLKEVLL